MGSLIDKLDYSITARENIKNELNAAGGNISNTDEFASYADKVRNTTFDFSLINPADNQVFKTIKFETPEYPTRNEGSTLEEYWNLIHNGLIKAYNLTSSWNEKSFENDKDLVYIPNGFWIVGSSPNYIVDCSNFFKGCDNLEFAPNIFTLYVTNMSGMFWSCGKLKRAPELYTENVTDMSGMFTGCRNLTYVPLYNTSKVTDMSNMFAYCNKITSVSLFDTSSVTNMSNMFAYCNKITSVPLFDTSNVTNINGMFWHCINLTDVPLLNTQNVTNMGGMFTQCEKLTSIPNFNTSNVTHMGAMFGGCLSLTTVPQFDTSKVTRVVYMFQKCTNLLSLPKLNFSSVTDIGYLFGENVIINTLTDLGGFTDLKVDWNDDGGLKLCPNLTKQSVLNVINELYDFRAAGDLTTTKTIKFNLNSLSLLSDEEKLIAINKGWNLIS